MPNIVKRLTQELKDLETQPIANCSAGPLDKDIKLWQATIFGPEDTPYAGGVFKVGIKFGDEYPFKPPIINFITPIYHCNINKRGNICLDILSKNWSPVLTIGKVLLSICSLLAEPNPDDPLVPYIADLYKSNKDVHDANAKEFTLRFAAN